MKKRTGRLCLPVWMSLFSFFALSAFGQNTFDGKSIELVAPDTGGRCVAGFGGDPVVKRIQGSSPENVYDCSGNLLGTITNTTGLTIARNGATGYWCFRTADTKVNVSYSVGTNAYSWTWIANTDNSGFYNVRDFGALGNGHKADGEVNTAADDTAAIKNALAYVGAKFGGTLYFPEGVYRVSSPLVLPSGIIIKGTSGMGSGTSQFYYSGNFKKSNSTISLVGDNKSLFKIGECVNYVKMENITLKGESNVNTNGVEAVGAYPPTPSQLSSSQEFEFENTAFDTFNKGLYFRAVDADKLWQIDYVNVSHCTFNYNKTAGIHIDSFNTDWKVSSTMFHLPVNGSAGNRVRGDGLIIERATTLHMSNSFGGGIDYSDAGRGGTFIKSLFVGGLTVINSSAERLSETISYGKDPNNNSVWGSYSNIITLINNGFGDPLTLHGRVNFISTGNSYAGQTVTAATGVRIYSTGDRFCMDLNSNYDPSAPCGRDAGGNPLPLDQAGFQGSGTIVFQSGQPAEKNGSSGQEIAAVPAKMKGDLEIKGNEREWNPNAASNSRPILSATVDNDGILPLKPLFRLGHTPFVYDVIRDPRGWLTFSGTQSQPYRGYFFSGAPLQIASFTLSQITASGFSLSQPGTIVYCSDCQRNTAPCTAGGSGTLAVLTGASQWDCK